MSVELYWSTCGGADTFYGEWAPSETLWQPPFDDRLPRLIECMPGLLKGACRASHLLTEVNQVLWLGSPNSPHSTPSMQTLSCTRVTRLVWAHFVVVPSANGQVKNDLKALPSTGAVANAMAHSVAVRVRRVLVGAQGNSDACRAADSVYASGLAVDPTSYCQPMEANAVSSSGAVLMSAGGIGTA
jgi:hypothetical protein